MFPRVVRLVVAMFRCAFDAEVGNTWEVDKVAAHALVVGGVDDPGEQQRGDGDDDKDVKLGARQGEGVGAVRGGGGPEGEWV